MEGTETLESLNAFQDTWPLAAGDTRNRCLIDVMPKKIGVKKDTATAKKDTATLRLGEEGYCHSEEGYRND